MHDPQIIQPKTPGHKDWKEYAILIGGIIALVAGFALLIQFALGIAFLMVGFYGVNRYVQRNRYK